MWRKGLQAHLVNCDLCRSCYERCRAPFKAMESLCLASTGLRRMVDRGGTRVKAERSEKAQELSFEAPVKFFVNIKKESEDLGMMPRPWECLA